jgi:hypothetical protein
MSAAAVLNVHPKKGEADRQLIADVTAGMNGELLKTPLCTVKQALPALCMERFQQHAPNTHRWKVRALTHAGRPNRHLLHQPRTNAAASLQITPRDAPLVSGHAKGMHACASTNLVSAAP